MNDLRTRIQEEMAQPAIVGYRWGTLVMALYLAGLVPLHLRATSEARGILQSCITGTAALVMVACHCWFRRTHLSKNQRETAVALTMLALLAQILSHIALRAKPELTSDVMLWIVASGLLFHRRMAFLLALVLAVGGWALLVPFWPPGSPFLHWSIGMFSAVLVALLSYTHVNRILQAHEDLRVEDRLLKREQEHLILWLRDSLDNIKTLKGLIPICAHCKKIRNDQGYWQQVEQYVGTHSEAEFTHGICPECATAMRAEFAASRQPEPAKPGPSLGM